MLVSDHWDLSASRHRDGLLCTRPSALDGMCVWTESFTPIVRAHGYLTDTPGPAGQAVPVTTN